MVFPGIQGGPLMHVIAAKAVAFLEALQPEFKTYSAQVIANARAMTKTLQSRGYKIVSGGPTTICFCSTWSTRTSPARTRTQRSAART